jgi:hypothetical protein
VRDLIIVIIWLTSVYCTGKRKVSLISSKNLNSLKDMKKTIAAKKNAATNLKRFIPFI